MAPGNIHIDRHTWSTPRHDSITVGSVAGGRAGTHGNDIPRPGHLVVNAANDRSHSRDTAPATIMRSDWRASNGTRRRRTGQSMRHTATTRSRSFDGATGQPGCHHRSQRRFTVQPTNASRFVARIRIQLPSVIKKSRRSWSRRSSAKSGSSTCACVASRETNNGLLFSPISSAFFPCVPESDDQKCR